MKPVFYSLFIIVIGFLLFYTSCKHAENNPTPGIRVSKTDSTNGKNPKPISMQSTNSSTILEDEKREEELIDYERFLLNLEVSLQGFDYVENEWASYDFFCLEEGEFARIVKLNDTSLIAISFINNLKCTVYHLNEKGSVLHHFVLENTDRFILHESNFRVNYPDVYFKKNNWRRVYKYNAVTKQLGIAEESYGRMEFSYNPLKNNKVFYRPIGIGGYTEIGIIFDNIYLTDSNYYQLKILSNEIPYGKWHLKNGCWSKDAQKFYFDNAGLPLACIWELDIIKRTIAKVIPEHEARYPIALGDKLLYIQNECLKIGEFIEYGEVILRGKPVQPDSSAPYLFFPGGVNGIPEYILNQGKTLIPIPTTYPSR